MAKDSGFVLQGYIRVDIYKKNTEYSRGKTVVRTSKEKAGR
jgi:hypothetical protein